MSQKRKKLTLTRPEKCGVVEGGACMYVILLFVLKILYVGLVLQGQGLCHHQVCITIYLLTLPFCPAAAGLDKKFD